MSAGKWLALAAIFATGCTAHRDYESGRQAALVAAVRIEPKTLNRFVSGTPTENILAFLTQATLVRVNRGTWALEPRLARQWSLAPDGVTYTLLLRDGVQFSDGAPFTADDVVFTFKVLYDRRVSSPLASSFEIDGRPLRAEAVDPHTVRIIYPSSYGPGLAILDSLPILPAHVLAKALDAGTFGNAWNVKTPPAEVVGLGPFVLTEYAPGQHLRFTRNPHFWLPQLPRLHDVELQIVPELNAEMLRLESGQLDVPYDFARAEDLSTLRRIPGVVLVDAGVDIAPNALWFDLAPGSPHAKDRPWLQREELRQAISYAVDRQAIVDTVDLGAGVPIYGPITPGHIEWYEPDLPKTPRDLAKAKALLASIGLIDRNHDGVLEDASGAPARFSILTQKGNTVRERTVAMLQDQLKKIGLVVDIVSEDAGQLKTHWDKGDYDAIYHGIKADTFDPARNLDFWMSSGYFHLWDPEQAKPATPWEARIDELMRRQSTTLDPAARRRIFKEVQLVFAEHLPAVYFAAPKATVAISARVAGATPSVLNPSVLWNVEALSIAPPHSR
jgi:peptide/nickel transport system substrate-binding protein